MSSTEPIRSSIGDQVHIIGCRKPDHALCGLVFDLFIGPICEFKNFRWAPGGGGRELSK